MRRSRRLFRGSVEHRYGHAGDGHATSPGPARAASPSHYRSFTKLTQVSDYSSASLTWAHGCPGAPFPVPETFHVRLCRSRLLLCMRKRLAGALIAMSLCVLIGACGNDDDQSPDTRRQRVPPITPRTAAPRRFCQRTPSSASPASPALPPTIQTPAPPASSADTALSAAASTPLATPVIHTVD